MDDSEVNNIIHAGVILILYMFLAVILFYVLSGPVDTIFDAFGAGSYGVAAADNAMARFLPDIRWAVRVAFALGFAFPIVWFIFWVFSRESNIGMVRRY